MNFNIEGLKFDEYGLIPAVVQDVHTREVLTLAHMNEESLKRTLAEKETWFWSRSRRELWHKGQTSGNTQRVVGVLLDCDRDAIVVLVEPTGPACHTGQRSCFHNTIKSELQRPGSRVESSEAALLHRQNTLGGILEELYSVIQSRKSARPEGSYTTYLFNEGLDKILKKFGEESAETIIAAKNHDPKLLIAETSDVIYHLIVLLVESGVTLEQIGEELISRRTEVGRK
jgi:phosphoribosyl-ATP pyrophosphohydrolase/phosphoribosyl-AMP cyclohydrolase